MMDPQDMLSEFLEEIQDIHAVIQENKATRKIISKKKVFDTAWKIHPVVGEFVARIQIVDAKIENLINSPKNLTLIGKKMRPELLVPADHIFVRRGLYTHHGIYIGDGLVIHYSPLGKDMINIHPVILSEFSAGDSIFQLDRDKSPLIYSPNKAVERAWSRVGEKKYHLIVNNCEQFVRWCRSGEKYFE